MVGFFFFFFFYVVVVLFFGMGVGGIWGCLVCFCLYLFVCLFVCFSWLLAWLLVFGVGFFGGRLRDSSFVCLRNFKNILLYKSSY